MWPDRISKPGPLTYESGALPTALRGPAFSMRYPVTCKVYTGYHYIIEIEHGSSACMGDNPLAKARRLILRTGGQTTLRLSILCLDDD